MSAAIKPHTDRFRQIVRSITSDARLTPAQKLRIFEEFEGILQIPLIQFKAASPRARRLLPPHIPHKS